MPTRRSFACHPSEPSSNDSWTTLLPFKLRPTLSDKIQHLVDRAPHYIIILELIVDEMTRRIDSSIGGPGAACYLLALAPTALFCA